MKLINFLMNNPCQDPNILKVILFIRKIMEVAFIAIPIVLIVLITFDFVKSVMAGTEDVQKKNVKIVIKRLIYAVMVFFVLPIVNIVFGAFTSSEQADLIGEDFGGKQVNYLTCWTNADSLDTINEFIVKVKFDGNGGNIYGESVKTCGGKENCEITNLPRTTKKGEYFTGWTSKKGDCEVPISSGSIIANNKVLQTGNDDDIFDETYYACYNPEPVETTNTKPTTSTEGSSEEIKTELPSVKYTDSKQIVTVYDKSEKKIFVYRCPVDYFIESGTNAQRVTSYSCKKKENDGTYSSSAITKMIIPKYVQGDYSQNSTCGGGTLAKKGCLPTSGAMIFGALQNDLTLTPAVMNDKAKTLKASEKSVCSGSSYHVNFLIEYADSVDVSVRTISSSDELVKIFKSKNALGVAPLDSIGKCVGDVKKVCYDSGHFVIFFPSENMDSGYVNVVDANGRDKGVFNIKISDLIKSTQSKIVRVFYK